MKSVNMKQPLQSVTPYKVMGIKNCLDALGWAYVESEERFDDISCPCGGEMTFMGFIDTEVVRCEGCGKHMVDLFSPIQIGNSAATILDSGLYEFERDQHWIVIDTRGGILLDPNSL